MKPVVHALIRKRAEIAGRIEAIHAEAARLVAELGNLDMSIRIFQPDIDLEELPVKQLPPPNAAFRGEFQRFLLELLRGSQRWQSTFDLTVKVMVQRRMNEGDIALRRIVQARVAQALRRLRDRKGVVASRKMGAGALLAWRITKPDANLEGGWRNGSSP
jgi:hypothetical protein